MINVNTAIKAEMAKNLIVDKLVTRERPEIKELNKNLHELVTYPGIFEAYPVAAYFYLMPGLWGTLYDAYDLEERPTWVRPEVLDIVHELLDLGNLGRIGGEKMEVLENYADLSRRPMTRYEIGMIQVSALRLLVVGHGRRRIDYDSPSWDRFVQLFYARGVDENEDLLTSALNVTIRVASANH